MDDGHSSSPRSKGKKSFFRRLLLKALSRSKSASTDFDSECDQPLVRYSDSSQTPGGAGSNGDASTASVKDGASVWQGRAQIAWNGIELLLRKVEGCLEGTPARAPVAAINALLDIKNAVRDNNGHLQDLVSQTIDRLATVDQALEGRLPDAAKPQMTAFASVLRKEINILEDMINSPTMVKVLESEDYKVKIERIFRSIDEATKTVLLAIAWKTERIAEDIYSDIQKLRLERLFTARKAVYNADLGGGLTLNREGCTEGTRGAILEQIHRWVQDTSPDAPALFWLTGPAGAGKTTIAYSTARYFDNLDRIGATSLGELPPVLGGSFLCFRQFQETRRAVNIIPTLAYQLSRKSGSFAQRLYENDKFDSADLRPHQQIQDLLMTPWKSFLNNSSSDLALSPNFLFIIDALDEIEDEDGPDFLRDLLRALENSPVRGLKFLITSRPNPAIVRMCESSFSQSICRLQEVPLEDVESDITRYLDAKLPRLAGMPELNEVAKRAQGLFIYAATIQRSLTARNSITATEQLDVLRNFLSTPTAPKHSKKLALIDELYKQIICDAFVDLDDDLFDARCSVLHTIFCSMERTSIPIISGLLSVPEDVVSAVIDDLHAVVYLKGGKIYWYHTSFQEFVFTQARSNFTYKGHSFNVWCNEPIYHHSLSTACIDLMTDGLRFNIGNIESSYVYDDFPLDFLSKISFPLRYSCRYWSHHLSKALTSTDTKVTSSLGQDWSARIRSFLYDRLLFWIEAMNLLSWSRKCPTILRGVRSVLLNVLGENSDLGLELIEAANFASYFIREPRDRKSTPHLYISALATWPSSSKLYRSWRRRFPFIPKVDHVSGVCHQLLAVGICSQLDCVALSLDGSRVVASDWLFCLSIWDGFTGEHIGLLSGHTAGVLSVQFNPACDRLVSGSVDKSIRLWDIETKSTLWVSYHDDHVVSVAFSHDAKQIVSGSRDTSIRVWSASDGAQLQIFHGHSKVVNAVAFSADGSRIVSGSEDQSIIVWDAESGQQSKVLTGHTGGVRSVLFTIDDSHIISASLDHTIRIWDSAGATVGQLEGHRSEVNTLAVSSNGEYLVSGSGDRSACFWSLATKTEIAEIGTHLHAVTGVAISHDNSRAVTVGYDRCIRIWDLTNLENIEKRDGPSGVVAALAISSDGSRIASGAWKDIRIWNASTGKQVVHMDLTSQKDHYVTCLAFSPDATKLVSTSFQDEGQKRIRVWDTSTGDLLVELDEHKKRVSYVEFSPDGKLLASCSSDQTVRLWNVQRWQKLHVFVGHKAPVLCAAFLHDGSRLVTGDIRGKVLEWDVLEGTQLLTFHCDLQPIHHVAFSIEGHVLAGGWSLDAFHLRNLSTGNNELSTRNYEDPKEVTTAFSPDSSLVAVCLEDTVDVWNVATRTRVSFDAHTMESIMVVAFSPDGKYIVLGLADHSVRVWHTPQPSHFVDESQFEKSTGSVPSDDYTEWTTDGSWIVSQKSSQSRHRAAHLMWIPREIRMVLSYPGNPLVISQRGSAHIDFSKAKLGKDWVNCYDDSYDYKGDMD